jgi:hypothetical protein
MERDIAKQIFSTLQRLEEENLSAFKRVVELSETKDLTVDQKVELYKLVMFYDRATLTEKEIIEKSVAGLCWNEGGQMNGLIPPFMKTRIIRWVICLQPYALSSIGAPMA